MEGFDGGLTLDDYIYVCRELARLGADAIEVSGDWMSLPSNKGVYFEKEAMAIAEENNIAVIVTGGNRNFEQMEQLLNSTNIGYFGMARPFISEPDLVNKYEKEHITKIRCISCNKCADPSTGCKCIFDR
jgi:2,4-dienoyl-CoA reductase-like NADH-dependent reductase (Old Yellow Enzyme family)